MPMFTYAPNDAWCASYDARNAPWHARHAARVGPPALQPWFRFWKASEENDVSNLAFLYEKHDANGWNDATRAWNATYDARHATR